MSAMAIKGKSSTTVAPCTKCSVLRTQPTCWLIIGSSTKPAGAHSPENGAHALSEIRLRAPVPSQPSVRLDDLRGPPGPQAPDPRSSRKAAWNPLYPGSGTCASGGLAKPWDFRAPTSRDGRSKLSTSSPSKSRHYVNLTRRVVVGHPLIDTGQFWCHLGN